MRSGTRGRAAFRVNGKWEWARYGLGAGLGAQPRVGRTWCCPHHPGQGAVCHFDGGGGRQQPYGGTVYPPESGRQLSHCNGLTCPFLWRKAEYSENTTLLQCCTGKKKSVFGAECTRFESKSRKMHNKINKSRKLLQTPKRNLNTEKLHRKDHEIPQSRLL